MPKVLEFQYSHNFNGFTSYGYNTVFENCSLTIGELILPHENASFYGLAQNVSSYSIVRDVTIQAVVTAQGYQVSGFTNSYDTEFHNCHFIGRLVNTGDVAGIDVNGGNTKYFDCSVKGHFESVVVRLPRFLMVVVDANFIIVRLKELFIVIIPTHLAKLGEWLITVTDANL